MKKIEWTSSDGPRSADLGVMVEVDHYVDKADKRCTIYYSSVSGFFRLEERNGARYWFESDAFEA